MTGSEAFLRSVLRATPIAFGTVRDRVILSVNATMCRMTGHAEGELVGRSARMLYPSEEEFEFVGREKYAQLREHGTGSVETVWRRRDGTLIEVLLSSTLLDPDDPATAVTFTALDITGRREAERRLLAESRRAQQYLDVAGVILLAINRDGVVTLVNRTGCEVLGYPEEEILGRNWFEDFVGPEVRDEVLGVSRDLLSGGSADAAYHENAVRTRDGGERLIAWLNTVLTDEAGAVVGHLSSGMDITERREIEEGLQRSRELLAETGRIARVGGWGLDAKTRRIWLSEEARDIYEVPPDRELTLDAGLRFFHPKDRAPMEEAIRGALDRGEPFDREVRLVTAGGRRLWIQCVGVPVAGEGRTVRLRGTIQDVTTRKSAEIALRAKDREYRTLVESSRDAIMTLVPGGAFLSGNPATVRLFRCASEADFVSRTPAVLSPEFQPDGEPSGPKARRMMDTAMERGSHLFDWRHSRTDGTTFEATVLLTRTEMRGQTILQATVRDVTEERAALAALRESEERFRSVAESSPASIISADAGGRIRFANGATEGMFGHGAAELLGMDIARLMPERYREPHGAGMRRFLRTREPGVIGRTVELVGLRGDGTEFPIELSLGSWRKGEEVFFSAIIRDITREREVEEQFRQSQKMEAVGRLAGGVAHDFNNYLTVISGYAEMLAERLSDDRALAGQAAQIAQAARGATVLTRQLLAFSRKQVLQPEALSLNDSVRAAEGLLRRAIGEDVDLQADLAADLPLVKADPGQMEQVIVNLAVNSRDSMPRGGTLLLETSVVALGEGRIPPGADLHPGPHVVLRVADSGHGMNAETRRHIFEPFFTTKGPGKGTGLGLATVFGIVRQSGGDITVDSEEGVGTTFRVYLPVISAGGPGPESRSAGTLDRPEGTETILLCEDEPEVREIVLHSLRGGGYTVLVASGGKEAVETARGHRGSVDMLLTDVIMPSMGGAELAERLREEEPGLKVLFMSGYTDDAIASHGVLEPGTHLLEKPFGPSVLLQRVRQVLDGD